MKYILSFVTILLIAECASFSKTKQEVKPLPDFDALWDYQKPEETEIKFRELIPLAKESGDLSYYSQLLTQIARTEGLQSKFEDAHNTLDTTLSLLTDEFITARVRYLLERGRVYNSSGFPDKARAFFLEAFELGVSHNEDFHTIDAIHMLQIVDPPEKQLKWAKMAIEMAEKSTDEKAKNWLGSLYNNTGWTYFDLGEYENALEMFEKSLKWEEEKGYEYWAIIAKWSIAKTYRLLGRTIEALDMQQALEKKLEEKGYDPDGYVYEELGECLLLLGEKEEAKKYFKLAFDILSKDEWLKTNKPERIERLKKLGVD